MSLTEKRKTEAVVSSGNKTVDMHFDEHAIAIAQRQYFQDNDKDLAGLFHRVANWVAKPEPEDKRSQYEQLFFDLMSTKRFCPGGRVLAGAATNHGNVLNCFVQDGSPKEEGSNDWVMTLATKLALVTKVGGGNGLCLDPIKSKQTYTGVSGKLYITVAANHADYAKVKSGTYMDLVHGKYITKGYRYATFIEKDSVELSATIKSVGDSVEGIWKTAEDVVTQLLSGQDVVLDLSDLRAEGTPVKGSGGNSSGPSSFAVEVFDNFAYWASLGGADYAGPVATLRYIFAPTLRVIRQGGTRRGAGMATMSIENADIQDFITCKDLNREALEGDISTFNISVLVGDSFMEKNAASASDTLAAIAEHAWQTGEPGLIYIDRINEFSAMQASMGDIKATNPCGEIPLYPGEPCDLGAINLAAYVERPNEGLGGFAWESFSADVQTCIRFLDNVLEVNHFALEDNREMSMRLRRLGLGIMGLADALIKMGYRYDSEEGREAVANMISELRNNAHVASKQLAEERGIFPDFEKSDLNEPRRNVAVLTVAPTGTTSMLMGVSSGVEPIFAPFVYRKIGSDYVTLIAPLFQDLLNEYPPHADCQKTTESGIEWDWDKIIAAVQENHGSVQGIDFIPDGVKTVLVCAHDISPENHVRMQGTVQRTFDEGGDKLANSISKTINMPNHATVDDVYKAYKLAFETGCKGITVYRDGSRQFQVLSTTTKKDEDTDEAVTEAAVVSTATQTMGGVNGAAHMPSEPVFERPTRVEGFTDAVKLTDAEGEKRGFYVTVNKQNDLPTEVFIISGKAGDEANADAEALGRLTSIALQYGVPAEAIISTLKGINGGVYGSYQNRMVASKADLIAIALETSSSKVMPEKKVHKSGCPDCGSPLRFEEGCQKCEACGFSKCG